MPLDDAAIERWSRQLVLPEIGPRGQARLAAARVTVTGSGPAAERVVAYLAAAGVGVLVIPAELDAQIDPAQPVLRIERPSDVVPPPGVAAAADVACDADAGAPALARRRRFWIADGRAGETPPCPACVAAALPSPPAATAALTGVREAVLGTIVATEIIKAIADVGTSLRGTVVTYAPATAACERTPVASRAACTVCNLFAAP